MNGLRRPVVAGVAGGVGVTTLAVALCGADGGRDVDAADIVVCRGTSESLRRAAVIAESLTGPAPHPVLAVTAGAGSRAPHTARLRELERAFGRVVVLPHVGAWRELVDPLTEAASLHTHPVEALPRPVRGYVDALREVAVAVTTSGRLLDPAGRRARRLWPGLLAIEHRERRGAEQRPDEPDDVVLEEEILERPDPHRSAGKVG